MNNNHWTGKGSSVLTRRKIIRWLAAGGVGAVLTACGGGKETSTSTESTVSRPLSTPTGSTVSRPLSTPTESTVNQPLSPPAQGQNYLTVVHGEDPAVITERAIQALGGIERFVKKGFDVIIKPNICTDYYTFEYGATTNPVVVATLVKLALGAGAKRVRVMDYPFGGSAESAYVKSGIQDAVKAAGGEMELMNPNKFKKTSFPDGKAIKEWPVYQDVLNTDLLIDVPIAKHHSLARLTLAGKNLMGVIEDRDSIHYELGPRIADLIRLIKPGLVVVDAVRILLRNGPTGGNLDDVKINNTVIASHDIVAADAYGATLFGLTGEDISYIKASAEAGLGTMDLKSIKIEEITA